MKGIVLYSSRTGRTRKLARGLYENLKDWDVDIQDIKDKPNIEAYDTIFLGFWAYKATIDPSVEKILDQLKGKDVYVFGTLAYYDDSDHAYRIRTNAIQAVEDHGARCIGSFITMGGLDQARVEAKKQAKRPLKHPLTKASLMRYDLTKDYPTDVDIAYLAEKVNLKLKIMEESGGDL